MKRFYITSMHDVYEDIYLEGEQLESVNAYTLDEIVEAENWKDAIGKYFQHVGFNLDFANCEVEDGNIQTSCLVDEHNEQPRATALDLWERGQRKLYANHITLEIKELVEVDLTKD